MVIAAAVAGVVALAVVAVVLSSRGRDSVSAGTGVAAAPVAAMSVGTGHDAAGAPAAATPTPTSPTSTNPTSARSNSTIPSTPFVPSVAGASASCVAADSVDAAGQPQSYQPQKAVDGRLDTAWRCSGDGVGASITVQFGGPVSLTSVGLVGGFDKVDPSDGADRFAQSPKVLRVRWTFDGGGAIEAAPGGQRSMYVTPVSVRASSVTLTILQTEPGIEVTNKDGVKLPPLNTMAVSEMAFTGLR